MNYKLFTSESVAAGHPDKICDQVSDAILDAALREDTNSRVAVETMVTKNRVFIAGEVTCKSKLNYTNIAKATISKLGYTKGEFNFGSNSPIDIYVHEQSPQISHGVEAGGAGDQGMVFGYATNETKQLMPAPIAIAHLLVEKLDSLRETRKLNYLYPDGKSQVTVSYEEGSPIRVENVVMAVAASSKLGRGQLKNDLLRLLIRPVLDEFGYKISESRVIINGAGENWTTPGPQSDTGVTGRKIVVDTYGGQARVGGGCFSGKDPTKVDRSGAYATRYIAKNIVAQGLADKAEVQIAYAIGQRRPVAFSIETFGTEKTKLTSIEKFAKDLIDLSVPGILDSLKLRSPIYQRTAAYGHFGRDIFPWENVEQM
ncbi:MAG: methionine adenosyltransferase [Candidatus Woykebacteria bacterium]